MFKKLFKEYEDLSLRSSSIIILISVVLAYLPIFFNINFIGIGDFDYNFFTLSVGLDAIKNYGELPLFNMFDQGGVPLLATPFSRAMSPFNIIYFFIDYLISLKIEIVLHALIGAFGMFSLLRNYKIKNDISIIASLIFSLNSYHSLNVAQGQYEFLTAMYVPWLFFSLRKKSIYGFILIWSLIFMEGGVYILAISFLGLFLYSLCSSKKSEIYENLKFLIIGLAGSAMLCAVKLFPSIEYMKEHPRPIEDFSGHSLSSMFHSLVNKQQFIFKSIDVTFFQDFMKKMKFITDDNSFFTGMDYGWDENGMYIGWFFFIVLIISIIYHSIKRESLREMGLLIFFALISFGDRLSPSLWRFLKFFSPYDSMRHATRFRIILILMMSVLIAQVLNITSKKIQKGSSKKLFVAGLMTVLLLTIAKVNYNVLEGAFVVKPFTTLTHKPFHFLKAWSLDQDYLDITEAGFYPAYLENIGVAHEKENHSAQIAVKTSRDVNYVSEISSDGKTVPEIARTSSSLSFMAEQNNQYTVNLNYLSGWKCKPNCIISNNDGLMKVLADIDGKITLTYSPQSFWLGLMISFISMICFIACLLEYNSLNKFFQDNIKTLFKKIV